MRRENAKVNGKPTVFIELSHGEVERVVGSYKAGKLDTEWAAEMDAKHRKNNQRQLERHLDAHVRNPSFYFGDWGDYATTVDRLLSGCDERAAEVSRFREEARAEIAAALGDKDGRGVGVASRRRKRRYGDEGDEVCIDRLMGGSDTPWVKRVREASGRSGAVDLAITWGGSCRIKNAQLAWGGVAALALSDALEEAGYSVSISLFSCSDGIGEGGESAAVAMKVKDAGEPLALGALSSLTAHGASFRTLAFAAKLHLAASVSSGLGCPVPVTQEHLEAFGFAEGALIMPKAYSREDALKAITSVTEKFLAQAA